MRLGMFYFAIHGISMNDKEQKNNTEMKATTEKKIIVHK